MTYHFSLLNLIVILSLKMIFMWMIFIFMWPTQSTRFFHHRITFLSTSVSFNCMNYCGKYDLRFTIYDTWEYHTCPAFSSRALIHFFVLDTNESSKKKLTYSDNRPSNGNVFLRNSRITVSVLNTFDLMRVITAMISDTELSDTVTDNMKYVPPTWTHIHTCIIQRIARRPVIS